MPAVRRRRPRGRRVVPRLGEAVPASTRVDRRRPRRSGPMHVRASEVDWRAGGSAGPSTSSVTGCCRGPRDGAGRPDRAGRRRREGSAGSQSTLALGESSDMSERSLLGLLLTQVAPEVRHRERDPPPLAGVDEPLLEQRVPGRRQRLRLPAEVRRHVGGRDRADRVVTSVGRARSRRRPSRAGSPAPPASRGRSGRRRTRPPARARPRARPPRRRPR